MERWNRSTKRSPSEGRTGGVSSNPAKVPPSFVNSRLFVKPGWWENISCPELEKGRFRAGSEEVLHLREMVLHVHHQGGQGQIVQAQILDDGVLHHDQLRVGIEVETQSASDEVRSLNTEH